MVAKLKNPKRTRGPAQQAPLWPAEKVHPRPIAKLLPYARNARTHSDAQIAAIAASIKEWGWTMPRVVDESGGLIAGHGRVLAAHLLRLTEAPVMVARGWTPAQIRSYRIADNKLALLSGWDEELLGLELADSARVRRQSRIDRLRSGRHRQADRRSAGAGWLHSL